MTNMTYNGDVAVTIDKGTIAATNYTVTGAKGDGNFSVVFKPEYVKTIEDGAVITLSYTATITSSALTTDPAKNTASLKTDNELPSTGGMGTTIFYALGAVLVIGAGVVLATRRRNAQ